MSSSDLANAIEEISIMADSINFPRIMIDKASRLLKAVHKGKNLKGHSTEALGAACLYIVCRSVYKGMYNFLFAKLLMIL